MVPSHSDYIPERRQMKVHTTKDIDLLVKPPGYDLERSVSKPTNSGILFGKEGVKEGMGGRVPFVVPPTGPPPSRQISSVGRTLSRGECRGRSMLVLR